MSTHSTQSIILTDEARIPIYFHGPIPYIHIRYPTDEDMELYTWIKITDTATWNPYEKDYNLSSVETNNNDYHFNKPIQYDELYTSILNSVSISGTSSNPKNKCLTPEALSSLWKIPLHIAKHTIKSILFSSIRTNEGRMSRRFRTDTYQRRYNRLGGEYSRFYTDTLFSKVRAITGDTCAQLYTNRTGFTKLYPMQKESNAHETLGRFIHQVGIPHELHSDGAKALIHGEYRKKLKKYEIQTTETEPYSPWQNEAERANMTVKKFGRYLMQSTNSPIVLWPYAYVLAANIRSLIASQKAGMMGRTPFETTIGYTPEISEYVSFAWYQWI